MHCKRIIGYGPDRDKHGRESREEEEEEEENEKAMSSTSVSNPVYEDIKS